MSKYYSEQIEKNTKYRQDYLDGLSAFLEQEKEKIACKREVFISAKQYRDDPEKYRKALVEMLGFPLNSKREEAKLLNKKFVSTDGNVNIYRMQFLVFDTLKFYGIYFEQTENKSQKPFVVGFHGGDGSPELVASIHNNSGNYNHLVRRITDLGASVFAPQLVLWHVPTYGNVFDRSHIDGKLRQLGGSITALELNIIRGCLDYFIKEEKMNADKLGSAGLSYGGMYAGYLAAIDERIKACYSCSWLNDSFIHSWCDWSYYKAQYNFTAVETFALISPRPLVIAMGDKDELFDYKKTIQACEQLQPYYTILNKKKNLKVIIFDGVHEMEKEDEGLVWFYKQLCRTL